MMTSRPTFSFLVPTFNRPEDLRRCLHSILATEYPHFQIVVNDNCSEDETQAVVAEFTDARISYKRQNSNIGPEQIGRAHVRTPVTNAHLVRRLLLDNKKHTTDLRTQ